MTAVEWLIEEIHKNICFIPVHIQEQAKEMENEQKILLVQELKDYTTESQCILGNDEREASEFVDIFNETNFKPE